jgi:glycolate oxidase FAD binding subunit
MPEVLDQLMAATAGHASIAAITDAVDGVAARWLASPGDTTETAAVMKVADGHGMTVVVRGAGTKLTWGAPPVRADVVVDTTRMDAVVEHAAGDLIVVAQAGCRLDVLQPVLAKAGQWLAVNPARRGTIGGTVATATTGPARLLHGPVRDLIIGITMVRADGVVAHAGGKVVKNVAGYDLGRLLTGSFGTLGVITQAAFRLHPVAAARSWVSVPAASREQVHEQVQRIIHSQLVPSAVELDRPSTGIVTLSILLEGIPPGVESRTAQALDLLGAGATADVGPPPWWGDEPFAAGEVALKLTHEIAGLRHLLSALDTACEKTGLEADLRGSVAVGAVVAGVRGPVDPPAVARLVSSLRDSAGSYGGTVVVLDAPPAVKSTLDVWGPVGGLDLMRSVKHQFDPDRRLAPGRFVGGI